ncbi:hypothetical protein QYE76_049480 [Lolium multiflorum]|uniref:Reverse transcriptase domain-containing protein n=1 Tax=Lolium multiflorum TaxID=4521 RepID=A0AAD8SN59_LOLMU|nr:hypothetical protein QYE76_049480 [Lolium multiflorum]
MKAEILEEVKKEIEKMLNAGFIRPCRYAEWISNVVPVEKKDGRWRVAIDFRNLNSATPKDEYPMPVAETLINAAAGHKVLSFMDGNAGYNQIFMAPEDIHKTAFRVPGSVGLFEYVVMTFGLKNAGATYQRAMNYIFHDLIGKLVEIYIDDVVVKSVSVEGHLEDLRHVLDRTRKFGLRMNPKKCAFGVTAGQFLGFLVHERGIEIGLISQEAVRTMKPPTTKKELQGLIGKINFVRMFISNLSGRIEPFMGLVKIKSDDEFHGANNKAFDEIKEYPTKPPCWCHQQDRPFYIYLSVADTPLLQWWYKFMMAWRESFSTSAEGCWMQKRALMSDSIEDVTELRLWSLEKIKENKAKVARAYNKKVRPKEFHVGDLVWEAVLPLGTKDAVYGKWSPNWHGPYRVDQVLKGNAYMLEQLDGVKFPVAVNGQHLKKYFPIPNLRAIAALVVAVVATVGAASGEVLVAADEAAGRGFIFLFIVVVVVVRPGVEAIAGGYSSEEESSSSSSSSSSSEERSPSQEKRSSSLAALMTHKYRGCIVVSSISKNVDPNEEQKVLTSSFDEGFTVNAHRQVFKGF